MSAFNILVRKYPHTRKGISIINHPSNVNNGIYLIFDSVHLLKNIRRSLFNAKRFIFPQFNFDEFYDSINLDAGEITWKLLHDVYDQDENLPGSLKKAYNLTSKSLHPGDNKQSVPLALSIFDATISAAIESYCPDRYNVSRFLKLINLWWTMSDSKQRYNTNFRIGDAAVEGDNETLFLRAFADWLERWKALQGQNLQKLTLTKQTCSALVTTLRCIACLIEDLLSRNYEFVLTSRLQIDPLELRFSKYRQMSGGRFLIGLRDGIIGMCFDDNKFVERICRYFW